MNIYNYGICQLCGDNCNMGSQQCGRCMKIETIKSFDKTNLDVYLQFIHTELERYSSRYIGKSLDLNDIKQIAFSKLSVVPNQLDLLTILENVKTISDWIIFMDKLKSKIKQ